MSAAKELRKQREKRIRTHAVRIVQGIESEIEQCDRELDKLVTKGISEENGVKDLLPLKLLILERTLRGIERKIK